MASYAEADDALEPGGPAAHGHLLDGTDDQPVDASRTLVFSIDLSHCLGDAAVTWSPGQVLPVTLRAADAGRGRAEEVFVVKLAPAL
jgi:hypothetical protein